jgi:GNAT superfamily N-acetyltransferase
MTILIRQASVQDAKSACVCLRRSITECCVLDHGNDQSILDAWLQNKTPENLREWLSSPDIYAIVAEDEGNILGVSMLSENGIVGLCYLVPEARFMGTGKAMLLALEEEARRRNLLELILNSTLTAHDFYTRNGYVNTGAIEVTFGMRAPEMHKTLAT